MIQILHGDVREVLPTLLDESVNCCVTSPPYWGLRDYGCDGQLGLEPTPEEYVAKMVGVFREVNRVLRKDGTLWLNMGDCYATGAGLVGECPGGGEQGERWKGHLGVRVSGKQEYLSKAMGPLVQPNRMPIRGLKPKDLVGMPWRIAFALQADGWYLRSDIIWAKPNPMPESVTDRPTKAHEYIFLLSKSERYYYAADLIAEPIAEVTANDRIDTGRFRPDRGYPGSNSAGCGRLGSSDTRNKRSVWTVATQPFPEAHFATFPEDLIKPCILAGCPAGGTVLDPFFGSGTTGLVARANGCKCIGIELNEDYIKIARKRLSQEVLNFGHSDILQAEDSSR